MIMDKIQSFTVNHDLLLPGIYISGIARDIVTYDLRFVRPNAKEYLSNRGMHTIEHLFATYFRNSWCKEDVVYFGPMGCRTGFYLLMRCNISYEDVISLIQDACSYYMNYNGRIYGARRKECGNYRSHSLADAKLYLKKYYQVIKNYTVDELNYLNK